LVARLPCVGWWRTYARQVQPGEVWQQSGQIFKRRGRIPAPARALWGVGYNEPWALVTNDARLTGHEYARRNWQEQCFRDLKSGGWHWGDSRLRSPQHVANRLVLLVIAYTWVVALGSKPLLLASPNRSFVIPTVRSGASGACFGKACATSCKLFNAKPYV